MTPERELYRAAAHDATGDPLTVTVEDFNGHRVVTLETVNPIVVDAADWPAFRATLDGLLDEAGHTAAGERPATAFADTADTDM